MVNKIFLVLLLLVIVTDIFSVDILLGFEESEVGYHEFDESIYAPHLFDIDSNQNIHIPDFYKNRIALFNEEGRYLSSVIVESAISPTMNYFSLNNNNTYTTFDRGILYLLDSEGHTIWQRDFGIDFIPSHIYTDNRGIFILYNNVYTYLSYSSNRVIGQIESIVPNGKEYNKLPLYIDSNKIVYKGNKKLIVTDLNNNIIKTINTLIDSYIITNNQVLSLEINNYSIVITKENY